MNKKNTCISITTLTNYLILLNSCKSTFYAADLNLSGAEVNAMHNLEMIQPTGVTKTVLVQHPYRDNLYFQFEAKEWQIIPLNDWLAHQIVEDIDKLANLVEGYNILI